MSDCGFMACKVIFVLGSIDYITDQYMESVNVQLYKVCITILFYTILKHSYLTHSAFHCVCLHVAYN